jgi:adenylyltransferase/sulfurtransferase
MASAHSRRTIAASASALPDRCLSANIRAIGMGGQRKLSRSTIGVAGLGGVGGIAFELLVRSGVGSIKISDGGFFEQSNANRQSLWSNKTDGMKKTEAAIEFAAQVAPACSIQAFPNITSSNSPSFSAGCASVIDATDSPSSRLAVFRGCKENSIPYIFSSALGTRGMLCVFGKHDFEEEFAPSKFGKRNMACDHSLGPVANAIGCISAQMAINLVLSKPVISFPQMLSLDAFSKSPIIIHSFE